ncbi:MAG TPA: SprT-like domain-containing protein, partial [Rubricoccaceae bacterium]
MHDLADLQARAEALMDALGRDLLGRPLSDLGWTFRFDRARHRLGLCTWARGGRPVKTVSLSRPLALALGWGVMEDVVRHEAAHAVDYETRGRSAHDAVWKALARRCGADPTATYEGPLADDGASKYVGSCPTCGFSRAFYRAPTRAYVCPTCAENDRRRVYLRLVDRASGRTLRAGGTTAGPGPPARYAAACPACGLRVERARRPTRRLACAPCCRR